MKDDLKHYAQKLRVLVVEDDPNSQKALSYLLNKYFVDVFVANDGEEALKLLQNNTLLCDIVIFDLAMPRLNGLAMFEQMIILQPSLEAIALSAHIGTGSYDVDKMNIKSLPKPVRPEHLQEVLLEICRKIDEKKAKN